MTNPSPVTGLVLATALVLVGIATAGRASASGCSSGSGASGDSVTVSIECNQPGGSSGDTSGVDSGASGEPAYLRYRWNSPCRGFSANGAGAGLDCGVARACPDPAERSWQLWGLSARTQGWEYITSECYAEPPTVAQAPLPTVTPALVLNAIRQMGLPSLEAVTQPADKTLVNFETIFYTEPEAFTRTVTLLGQSVDVEASPSQYAWNHGDGTTVATSTPGAPYPSKEITHNYIDAHVTVAPSVDVTYTARFRVSGGAWQGIDETVTIAGPTTDLRISEATALLSGEYE